MRKKIFPFLILFFVVNKISSQSSQEKMEKIKLSFKELNNYKPNLDDEKLKRDFFIFYEDSELRDCFVKEKIMSGSLCSEFYQSKRMKILKNIYTLYFEKEENQVYKLIDDSFNVIYDIKLYNCTGMKEKMSTKQLINEDKIDELENSYKKWFKILEEKGENYMKQNDLSPTSFTKYKWIQDIGFINEGDKNTDFIAVAKSIICNGDYMNYFVRTNELNRFYKGLEDKEIVSQIAILAYINKFKPFTHNILNFSIQFNSTILDSNTLLDNLNKLNENERVKKIFDLINRNEIIIKLAG